LYCFGTVESHSLDDWKDGRLMGPQARPPQGDKVKTLIAANGNLNLNQKCMILNKNSQNQNPVKSNEQEKCFGSEIVQRKFMGIK